jgi:hypothetical protein
MINEYFGFRMEKGEIPINGDNDFAKTRKYLQSVLKDIIDGKAAFIEIYDVERRLESTIKKRENSIQR